MVKHNSKRARGRLAGRPNISSMVVNVDRKRVLSQFGGPSSRSDGGGIIFGSGADSARRLRALEADQRDN